MVFSPPRMLMMFWVAALAAISSHLLLLQSTSAFVITSPQRQRSSSPSITTTTSQLLMSTTTVIPGTEQETEKKEKELKQGKDQENTPSTESDGAGNKGPIEWLIDDPQVGRNDEDPFHILLLDETFHGNNKITINYVASTCNYVLAMPYDEAAELAAHAEQEGMSCLGTWEYQECMKLGKQLQNRDLVCRVVPYCEGGDRAWQARNMKDEVWEI